MASPFAIRHAAHQIQYGGVIAYPTDTVYGLGCDPLNANAVTYLSALKQRDSNKGLILVANRLEFFDDYIIKLTEKERKTIEQERSPTSWVVSAKKNIPCWLTGDNHSLAIRITQHPIISELCNQLQHPLVSSSANPSNKKPALTALELHKYFHNQVHAILITNCKNNAKPSSIKVLSSKLALR